MTDIVNGSGTKVIRRGSPLPNEIKTMGEPEAKEDIDVVLKEMRTKRYYD